MRARGGNQAGFTLIELMIVLILIGIFSGLIVAEMRGTYEDALLRSTARKLISAANIAGSEAVTLNRAHTLSIDTAAGRFAVRMNGPQTDGESQDAGLVEEGNLDSRIKIEILDAQAEAVEEEGEPIDKDEQEHRERDRQQISFYADGTAEAREIVLRDRMEVELRLRINPVTGRIRIVEGEVGR